LKRLLDEKLVEELATHMTNGGRKHDD